MPTKPAAPATQNLDSVQAAPTRQVKVSPNPAPAPKVPTSGFGGKYQHVGTAPSEAASVELSTINVNPSLPGPVGVDAANARAPLDKTLTRDDEDKDDDDTPVIS